jgi:CheY-like chemotaxis protein
MKVLIVEDHPDMRDLLGLLVERLGMFRSQRVKVKRP